MVFLLGGTIFFRKILMRFRKGCDAFSTPLLLKVVLDCCAADWVVRLVAGDVPGEVMGAGGRTMATALEEVGSDLVALGMASD